MSLLMHPSVKLLLKHLQNCRPALNSVKENLNSSKPSLQSWIYSLPQGSFNFSVVWIQGHILKVEDSGKNAVLSDGTGEIVLRACDKITAKPEIKEGMYMMAIGTLTRNGENQEIKPFKLQDLTNVEQGQESWHLEVIDQIHYLINGEKNLDTSI